MSEEKMEHSPLPWRVSGKQSIRGFGADDWIAKANWYRGPANAQFIITACNSYYDNQTAIAELVEALGKMQSVANNAFAAGTEEREYGSANRQGKLIDKYESVLREARALIAKHKAGE